ncbi:MAG: ComF family protein [candidate division WOR-3 bacterium]|nr:MAG: ComF family protein [candidate division WOR-3 bacterium]
MFAFLLPQRCLACGQEIETGFLCNNCHDYLPVAHSPRCRWCGRPIKKKDICTFCKQGTHLDHGRTWLLFVPPVDVIIHAFKYRRMSNISRLLGQGMTTVVRSDHVLRKADIVTPVPLFWWKRMHRTYNQASLLSKVISDECHIPHAELLQRIRYTRTQTRLDDAARRKNVASAFSVKKSAIQDKNILLVDDVMTTGATMNECARTLKAAGAKEVYSCVAAITPE